MLTVRTALDIGIQKQAETAIEDMLRQYGDSYHAKQARRRGRWTRTARVRAMVGGRDYGASQFNRATDALRQPGSSFKPFVYTGGADDRDFKPTTHRRRRAALHRQLVPATITAASYAGRMPLATALAKSLNTVPVRLSIAIGDGNPKVGRAKIIEICRARWASPRRWSTPCRCRSARPR